MEKLLIFLCPKAAKADHGKLSYRLADRLETLGIGNIGTLQDLSRQRSCLPEFQRRMVFISDCSSGCVRVLTHGFNEHQFIYLDISPFLTQTNFHIEAIIEAEILSRLNDKWSYNLHC
jgi:hypothetical protein